MSVRCTLYDNFLWFSTNIVELCTFLYSNIGVIYSHRVAQYLKSMVKEYQFKV